MNSFLIPIVNLSISASWLILAVLLLRLLLRKAPKSVHLFLWALVGLRLLIPFSFESNFSLVPSRETIPQEILIAQTPAIQSGIPVVNAAVNPLIVQSLTPTDPTVSANPAQILDGLYSLCWAAGLVLLLLYGLISYLLLRRRVRTAVRLEGNLWQSEVVQSPFILGIFRPRIYLPFHLSTEAMDYIVAHEKAHLRRLDHLTKPLAFLILAVYWFNPLVWLCYFLLCRDMELACDQRVVGHLGAAEKKAYSLTLLECSAGRRFFVPCPLAFGEVGVKQRVAQVLHYKKPAFWLILLAVLACIVVAVCFLTDPKDHSTTLEGVEMQSYVCWQDGQKVTMTKALAEDLIRAINEAGFGPFTPCPEEARAPESSYLAYFFSDNFKLTSWGTVTGGTPVSYALVHNDQGFSLQKRVYHGDTSKYYTAPMGESFENSSLFAQWNTDLLQYFYVDRAYSIYALKTPYIGNAMTVGHLLQALIPDNSYTISLQTSTEPYGITLNYDTIYDEASVHDIDRLMDICGPVFLALVENAGTFSWEYTMPLEDGSTFQRYGSYSVEELKKDKIDVKAFAASPEKFRELWSYLQNRAGGAVEAIPFSLSGSYQAQEVVHWAPWSSYYPVLDENTQISFYFDDTTFQVGFPDPYPDSFTQSVSIENPRYLPIQLGRSLDLLFPSGDNRQGQIINLSGYTTKTGWIVNEAGTDTGFRIFLLDDQLWVGHWDYYGEEGNAFWCEYLFRIEPNDAAAP